jgi:DNA-binding Xre family transcriptional regulator
MRTEVAHRRIEAFGKRFGEAHLYLAYHAAFPLALTPDLLYRLWANFQRDIHGEVLNIPWIAVADLLLSSLCDEVGHELYEMEKEVRNALLSELKANPRFGTSRINELSNFLLAYVRQQLDSPDIDTRDFAQAQKWTALAYVRPNEAARDIASALKSAYQQDRAELVRMASLVETFAEPLAEFNPLLVYARGMGNLARGDWKGAAVQFDAARGQRREVRIAGVSLPIPEQILVETSQTPAPESNRSGVGSLRASKRGLEIVDRARRKKGWNKDAPAWIDATGTISRLTLQRFWRQQPIRAENFLAICKAVGIDEWENIVDSDPIQETPRRDWSAAPDISTFYGRNEELATLEQWIVREHCRLVALLGRTGIGKTFLSVKLAEQIQDQFEYVIWRSLLNDPPLQDVLADLIKFLSKQQETDLPQTLDSSVSRLISYLQRQRCLLVLDETNFVMHRYEEYGYLLRQVGETPHQSCLVLVSQQKPREIELLEEAKLPVRSLELASLSNPLRVRRSLIASPQGIEKAKLALVRRNLTQKALANESGIASWSTINKFFNGKPVDRSLFLEICEALDLAWEEIAVEPQLELTAWSSPLSSRRLLTASPEGIEKAKVALNNKNLTQRL